MTKMSAEAFLNKHGSEGLRDVIGSHRSGDIIKGNDYANVFELVIELEKRGIVCSISATTVSR